MRKILIIGATSAIAEATARIFAARGDALFLVARNADRLQAIATDLNVRGTLPTSLRTRPSSIALSRSSVDSTRC